MARNVQTIRIESILGGHSPTSHFSAPDQFYDSIGIDPAQTAYGAKASGLIYPVGSKETTDLSTEAPLWFVESPRSGTDSLFIYDAAGSVYTMNVASYIISGLGDLNDGGSANGNGAAYYDNYMYFARDTTVARYGPLDGTPAWTDDYWTGTLGKTALSNTLYPSNSLGPAFPNHILHRHSDGKLYIADVVGNQGTLHYIKTAKTTVEGDTDDGSTYDKITVGYGLWPTAMESYGDLIAIAFTETGTPAVSSRNARTKAKLALWDTTSDKVNSITWVEFPDEIISSIKNINGVLYILSGAAGFNGFRLSRLISSNSIEELFLSVDGELPYPGAVTGTSGRVLIGSYSNNLESAVSVYSYNLNMTGAGQGMFNVMSSPISSGTATALFLLEKYLFELPIVGFTTGSTGTNSNGVLRPLAGSAAELTTSPCWWWSQIYRIGQPFKITKIRINFENTINANQEHIITPSIFTDASGGTSYIGGQTPGLSVISSVLYEGKNSVVLRPQNLTGNDNFQLELKFTGRYSIAVSLPITIEYELIDD